MIWKKTFVIVQWTLKTVSTSKWFGFSKHHYSLDSCWGLSCIHHMVLFLLSIKFHGTCAVKTMSSWRRMGFEKGEDGEIGWQGEGHGFLGCTRNHLHLLLRKKTNDNWSVSGVVIAPDEQRNQEKTSSFDKDPLSSR